MTPSGCERWPEHLRLVNLTTGELIPGRCKATNLCLYCRVLYTVETVEMLSLDAMEWPPTLYVVLTARQHLTRSECRDHLRQLRRSLRKRWPVEWAVQVEFQKRGALHLNLMVKGVTTDDAEAFGGAIVGRWCARVDAEPAAQYVGVIAQGEAVIRYIAKTLAHGLKAEQAPPLGWRGHRTSQTRGYLVRPASEMREEARRALAEKRLLHRAVNIAAGIVGGDEDESVPGALVEAVWEQLSAAAADASWRLVGGAGIDPLAALRRDARAPFASLARSGRVAPDLLSDVRAPDPGSGLTL